MSDVARILIAVEQGDPRATKQLLPLVYDELRKLAAAKLAKERPGQTLDATALVHEAYLRLVAGERRGPSQPDVAREAAQQIAQWKSQGHFLAAAAEAMRRILVDQARRKATTKHGGKLRRVNLEHFDAPEAAATILVPDNLLALDNALEELAKKDPRKAELVKLRFFAGLTMPEAAEALGVSLATAERYWTYARAWLFAEVQDASAKAQAKARDQRKQKRPNR